MISFIMFFHLLRFFINGIANEYIKYKITHIMITHTSIWKNRENLQKKESLSAEQLFNVPSPRPNAGIAGMEEPELLRISNYLFIKKLSYLPYISLTSNYEINPI